MVLGIGVDLVQHTEMGRLLSTDGGVFAKRVFTQSELEQADRTADRVQYLSSRFAAKEAVFKAVAMHAHHKDFDLRIVETLDAQDGHPYIRAGDGFQRILDEAGIKRLLVSLSHEGEYSIAMVVAE
jgi:phosphopantetheine--protein transferase-like protein